jgi:hypothetical protein
MPRAYSGPMPGHRSTHDLRFVGRIAGVGTASGTRVVVGMWRRSPFGTFADVMVERPDGHRMLLAPRREVAAFVSSVYDFAHVETVPVAWGRSDGGLRVRAGDLDLRIRVGGLTPLGRALRAVPAPLATRAGWAHLVDPAARILVPGARTVGRTRNGWREIYGVTAIRRIAGVEARWGSDDLGPLAPLDPPVRFGFASSPASPSLMDVTSVIRVEQEDRD